MEPIFRLATKKLLKVGGSMCLSIPNVWIKAMKTDRNTEFNIELLDDHSIRIKPS